VNQASGAHAASAISVADAGNNLNAANVEAALAEILDAFEGDHFRATRRTPASTAPSASPSLGGTKALILDSNASGTAATRLRIYADTGSSVWFTLNASWDGAQWVRDASGTFCGGVPLRAQRDRVPPRGLVRSDVHDLDAHVAPPDEQHRQLRVRADRDGARGRAHRDGVDQQLQRDAHGRGRWRRHLPQPIPGGAVVDHAQRRSASGGFSGTPSTGYADRDGFGFFSYQSLAERRPRTGSARTPRSREEHMAIQEITEHRARPALRQVRPREPHRARRPRGRDRARRTGRGQRRAAPRVPDVPLARVPASLAGGGAGASRARQLGHLHRLLVDELHSELVKKGRVVAKLRGQGGKVFTRPIATAVKQRFFDKGLKLPARAVEQLQGKEPGQ
jgi:hypothetical protein